MEQPDQINRRFVVLTKNLPQGVDWLLPWCYIRTCIGLCPLFQTSFSLKPHGKSKPNFMWNLVGKWEHKFCKNGLGNMTKMAAKPIYVQQPLKFFFFRTQSPMVLKLGMQHKRLKIDKVYINDDPGLTLTYFMARSNLVTYAFGS